MFFFFFSSRRRHTRCGRDWSSNVCSSDLCMKHFPGHGDTDVDSHLDLPTVNKSKAELSRIDWSPYRRGRLTGASAIMMGHLNVPALDDSGLPSSFSPKQITGLVREE